MDQYGKTISRLGATFRGGLGLSLGIDLRWRVQTGRGRVEWDQRRGPWKRVPVVVHARLPLLRRRLRGPLGGAWVGATHPPKVRSNSSATAIETWSRSIPAAT
jgi:hypothetical protein